MNRYSAVRSQYSKHVDSPSSYLTLTMIQFDVCLYRLPLESLSTRKISKLLFIAQIRSSDRQTDILAIGVQYSTEGTSVGDQSF